jgi:hypothetical protein
MKRLLLLFILCLFILPLHAAENKKVRVYNTATKTWAEYTQYTIRQLTEVPLDSLKKLDTLQNTDNTRWTLQAAPHALIPNDTVVVVALVITASGSDYPNEGLTFTQHGWTMLIHDTAANSNLWGGALVRVGTQPPPPLGNGTDPDTSQARLDKFNNVAVGDIIRLTCTVEEFPTTNAERVNSTTQLRPVHGILIQRLSQGHSLPAHTRLTVPTFYKGNYPGGQVMYSTGEPYEGSLVELNHLTIREHFNVTRGQWAMVDSVGNYIADYDASHYFTLGNELSPTIPGDPSFVYPPVGAVIDTIRGTMLTVAGGENPRGYRICPIYQGDVVFAVSNPTVNSHRRYPVMVTANDTVSVQARVVQTIGVFPIPSGYPIAQAVLVKSINNGPWISQPMSMITPDSIYEAKILDPDGNPWPVGTNVKYFIKGIDDHGKETILANASSANSLDSIKGFFFYKVTNGTYTIHDIQYTPFPNGRSAYVGGVVTLHGIVTASSHELSVSPLSSGGARSWYIQDGTGPWNGIWILKDTSVLPQPLLDSLHLGDSVTIVGSVSEFNSAQTMEVTRIFDSLVTINAHNKPLPQPVTVPTSIGGKANGDSLAERCEGTLIRIVNATVTDVAPTFSDGTEYSIDDGSGPIIVRRDGINSYSNVESDTTSGKTHIFHVGDKIDTLIGIGYSSFNRYKIVPRTDADFVSGTKYTYNAGWRLVSIANEQLPKLTGYHAATLFPGYTVFSYSGSYGLATDMFPGNGFWIKFPITTTARMFGRLLSNDTIPLSIGWNLVGAIGSPVAVSSLTVRPVGTHLSNFFGYTTSYVTADSLKPGQGYWVKSDSVGYIVLKSTAMMPKMSDPNPNPFNTLTITDRDGNSQVLYFATDAEGKIDLRDYEMPPPSPVEGFRVSYASGRILETYPSITKAGTAFPIMVNAKNGPLSVSWNIVNGDKKRFTIVDGENGKYLKATTLYASGIIGNIKAGVSRIILQVDGGVAVPKEFSLSQNYPNPFNPSTKVVVGLPQTAPLEVAVYNILGQKVATLVNEVREAGYHTITWNGTTDAGLQVGTGVYFFRMNAGTYTAIRKVMMMK